MSPQNSDMIPTRDTQKRNLMEDTVLEKKPDSHKQKQTPNHMPLPSVVTKAKSSMSHIKIDGIQRPLTARPTTPNVPDKTPRGAKTYSKPWLINTAADQSQDGMSTGNR